MHLDRLHLYSAREEPKRPSPASDRRDDHRCSSSSASNFLLITPVNQHLSGPLPPTANLRPHFPQH